MNLTRHYRIICKTLNLLLMIWMKEPEILLKSPAMDKVNAKLNALNTMMEQGAKTNQVFNQVFEYLAEWVDNASVQINSITDRVETLGEISQIKDMLADLKAVQKIILKQLSLLKPLVLYLINRLREFRH